MTCKTCEGNGFVKNGVEQEYIDTYCVPCQYCDSECSKCENTGWFETYDVMEDRDKTVPCPACWDYEKCWNCWGDGEVEEGAYDPQFGHYRGALYDCQRCDGHGKICTGWAREDAVEPDAKPSTYGTFNPDPTS